MNAGGIRSSEAVDELESHLRDQVAQTIRRGVKEPRAFELAVQQIGSARVLKREFNKNDHTQIMKRILIIIAGIIGILVGMAFVMPAVAQYRHEGAMTHEEVWLLMLGAVLTLAGFGAAVVGARKRLA